MEMKRSLEKILSLMLCLAVAVSMCLCCAGSVYAESGETKLPVPLAEPAGNTVLENGASITADKASNNASIAGYSTPVLTDSSADFTYNVNMPKKGTLVVQYASTSPDVSVYVGVGSNASYAGSKNYDGTEAKMYYVPSAGNVAVTFSVYARGTVGAAAFAAWYVPSSKKVSSKSSETLLGSTGYDSVSTVKVTVPSNGYLTVSADNGIDPTYSIRVKANGFKDWSYFSQSKGFSTNIGVKKGTYTISLKGAAVYEVSTSFHKVKETSAKSSKKKSASIKKGKLNKGIIPANNRKKVHWYKIKNPKNQKMTLSVNAKKMSDGGSIGSLYVTVYTRGQSTSYRVYAGSSDIRDITYGKIGTKKASKGTYYVKIESNEGANGYYTFKWK
ncbi:MAG: hypothetical protein IJJ06_09470 [Mogibacterium sp.]|nr:hypothetical protein [Mogibacterium sp.]